MVEHISTSGRGVWTRRHHSRYNSHVVTPGDRTGLLESEAQRCSGLGGVCKGSWTNLTSSVCTPVYMDSIDVLRATRLGVPYDGDPLPSHVARIPHGVPCLLRSRIREGTGSQRTNPWLPLSWGRSSLYPWYESRDPPSQKIGVTSPSGSRVRVIISPPKEEGLTGDDVCFGTYGHLSVMSW